MGFKITVEIPMFMSVFSFMLLANINTNLMIFRTCYVTLGYNKTDCAKLGMSDDNATAALEKLVEPTADVIAMIKGIVEGLASSILCIFVAPWSDRFGRKPILVLGTLGGTLTNIIMSGFAYFDSLSAWYMMLGLIPFILTGGGAAFMTVLMAYLTDTTSERQRGFRMGIFEGAMGIGVFLGTVSSAYILQATNYVAMYLIAAACQFFAMIYVVMFIPESLTSQETQDKLQGFFELTNIKDMFKTAFKHRDHNKRTAIMLLVLTLSLFYVCVAGNGIQFLWLRAKFGWTLVKYNWFGSMCDILWISGTILVVYIMHHRLKISEIVLIVIGFLGYVFGNLAWAFATQDWHIYLGAVIKLAGSGISPLTHSFMSKMVQPSEVAKILSIFNIANSLMGLAGSPMFTTFYNYTLRNNLDPGLFNFLTSGIHFMNFILTGLILIITKRNPRNAYATMAEDTGLIINSNEAVATPNDEETNSSISSRSSSNNSIDSTIP